ncbi:MAG: exopolyphosphatase, partial [Ignavibacteria bacterium]
MPENLAAIDIGTNSFHLIVAKILDDGSFEIIDREKEVIRLSEGTVGDIKLISPEAMERGIKAIKNMKGIADSHGASVHAAATSALRESLNKDEFIEKVYDQTGIRINLINGEEEARLIYLGILRALNVYEDQILSIDIGGGSTEFTIGKKGKTIYSKSIKLGAVRLTQMFFPDFKVTQDRLEECRSWVHGTFYPIAKEIKRHGFDFAVGTSGTIMSAGILSATAKGDKVPDTRILNNYRMEAKDFYSIYKKVISA